MQLLRRLQDRSPVNEPESSGSVAGGLPGEDTDEDSCQEAAFAGIEPGYAEANLKNPNRQVRTRLYFTSESHIQALVNVIRHCHLFQPSATGPIIPEELDPGGPDALRPGVLSTPSVDASLTDEDTFARQSSTWYPLRGAFHEGDESGEVKGIACPEQEERLRSEPVFDYLTQIVLRLYEDKGAPAGCESRYRVEVLFSPGASGHPGEVRPSDHAMPVEPLRPLHSASQPLTLKQLERLLGPLAGAPISLAPKSNSGGVS